jgi:hypothetical protein
MADLVPLGHFLGQLKKKKKKGREGGRDTLESLLVKIVEGGNLKGEANLTNEQEEPG